MASAIGSCWAATTFVGTVGSLTCCSPGRSGMVFGEVGMAMGEDAWGRR